MSERKQEHFDNTEEFVDISIKKLKEKENRLRKNRGCEGIQRDMEGREERETKGGCKGKR